MSSAQQGEPGRDASSSRSPCRTASRRTRPGSDKNLSPCAAQAFPRDHRPISGRMVDRSCSGAGIRKRAGSGCAGGRRSARSSRAQVASWLHREANSFKRVLPARGSTHSPRPISSSTAAFEPAGLAQPMKRLRSFIARGIVGSGPRAVSQLSNRLSIVPSI